MNIQVLSDLHLELLPPSKVQSVIGSILIAGGKDVLVLAGDIGNPEDKNYALFLDAMSEHFKKVFVISGNHEAYHGTVASKENRVRYICSRKPNVSYLSNNFEDYAGYRWLGTTLWTHVSDPKYKVNDFRRITNMSVDTYNHLNDQAVSFLEKTLRKSEGKHCIVITHHLPSFQLIHPKYKNDPYNQCFASNLDNLIEKYSDRMWLWCYGHTHNASDKTMHGVRMVCNPIGYAGENDNPDYGKMISLPYIRSLDNTSAIST